MDSDERHKEQDMTTERWEIDASHSGIHFAVRHLVIAKVRGQFSRWSGTLTVPEGDFDRASVDVTVDASSIETGVADRDTHLKSADFFDVAKYPEITFRSTRFEPQGEAGGRLTGTLTIRGISRDVVLDVERHGQTRDPWGNERAGFTARTAIDRKDFGLTWNQALETGGFVVGDRVELELEIEAVRQAAETAAAAKIA
jgi:polyisoprenoid-binding protein YceI